MRLCLAVCLLVSVLVATGCSNGYPGTWKAQVHGTDVTIILKSDGKATVQGKDGTWRVDGDHIVLESSDKNDSDTATAKLSDDGKVLSFFAAGESCTFARQ